jgi:hypothetical protein
MNDNNKQRQDETRRDEISKVSGNGCTAVRGEVNHSKAQVVVSVMETTAMSTRLRYRRISRCISKRGSPLGGRDGQKPRGHETGVGSEPQSKHSDAPLHFVVLSCATIHGFELLHLSSIPEYTMRCLFFVCFSSESQSRRCCRYCRDKQSQVSTRNAPKVEPKASSLISERVMKIVPQFQFLSHVGGASSSREFVFATSVLVFGAAVVQHRSAAQASTVCIQSGVDRGLYCTQST